MDDVGLVAGVPLLAGLPPAALAHVAAEATLTQVLGGQLVFRQGERGDSLYVVRVGRLEVLVDDTVVRTVGRGEVVGELALLGGGLRTATVRALRDSELLTISADVFESLLRQEPSIATALLRELSGRLSEGAKASASSRASGVIAVVAAMPGQTDVQAVADLLAVGLGAARFAESDSGPEGWASGLDVLERSNNWAVLAATEGDGAWADFCRRQADRVIAVVDPARPPQGWVTSAGRPVEFAFTSAQGLQRWLDACHPRTHYLCRGTSDDAARMTRRVGRRAVGLVLSGGGARALAHIGVLRALESAGVVVDRVGGTSMGAALAGLIAMGRSPSDLERTARRELVERNPFRDYTVPRHSLVRAERARAMLERMFGSTRIEELARPMYCVSCDLVGAREVVHRTGLLSDAVGNSMRMPGVAPPRRDNDRLLVDGGVLNNLPVDVMAADDEGPVIAVDVAGHFAHQSGRLPTLVETISRAMVLGSRRKAADSASLAQLSITPRLDNIRLFDFARLDEIVRLGQDAAEKALAAGQFEEALSR